MHRSIRALVLGVSLLGATPCAVGLDPTLLPVNVQQRGYEDCVVAALASMARVNYEQVDEARVALGIQFKGGLDPYQAIRIAARLGLTLELVRAPNLIADDGVLWVRRTGPLYHAVALQDGWIYDPAEARPAPWVLWFDARDDAEPAYLLRPIE